jgi:hypothetical protein
MYGLNDAPTHPVSPANAISANLDFLMTASEPSPNITEHFAHEKPNLIPKSSAVFPLTSPRPSGMKDAMKRHARQLCHCAAVLIFAAACATPGQRAVQPTREPIRIGMSLDRVRAAVGVPLEKTRIEAGGNVVEVWRVPARNVRLEAAKRSETPSPALWRLEFQNGVLSSIEPVN